MKPFISKIKSRLLFALLATFLIGRVSAQVFVISNWPSGGMQQNSAILAYNFDGTFRNWIFLPPGSDARNMVTDGTNLYIDDYSQGVVGEYTPSGGIINTSLISGLTQPFAMAISGTNLYVGDFPTSNGRIGKYSISGTVIDTNFIASTGGALGITVIGTNLYTVTSSTTIGQFSTADGTDINNALISGLYYPGAMCTDGTNLFIINNGSQYPFPVAKYSPTGIAISPVLFVGLGVETSMAVSGTNLYAVNNAAMMQLTTSGGTVNTSFISMPYQFYGITIIPAAPGPPPTISTTTYSNQPVAIWPANGGSYTLQVTNQSSGGWTTLSNYQSVTGVILTNAPPSAFFRLAPSGQ